MPGDRNDEARPPSRSRVEALSDGVFAIALTLLTLNVRLDTAPHETFAHSFRETLPQLVAYAISFAVITLYWLAHHRLFASLATLDIDLVVANFVYLAIVALIPFPSQVLGNNGGDVGPVILYATILTVGALMSGFMWEYARRRGLFGDGPTAPLVLHSVWRSLTIAAVFVVSIPIAVFAGAAWAEVSWLLMIPIRLVLRRRFGPVRDVLW